MQRRAGRRRTPRTRVGRRRRHVGRRWHDVGLRGGQDGCPNGTTCQAEAPSGWLGPVSLELASGPDGECDVGTFSGAGVGAPGGDATCGSCACADAAGQSCPTEVEVAFWDNSPSCAGAPDFVFDVSTNTCLGTTANGWFQGYPVIPEGGSCAASGGEVANAPPMFVQWAHMCAIDTPASCESAGVCAPTGAACIYQEGSLPACPPGPYAGDPLVVATDVTDQRGCSPCTCETPSGGQCSGYKTQIYVDNVCSVDGLGAVSHDNGLCHGSSGSTVDSMMAEVDQATITPGSCEPSGGEPSGTVEVGTYLTLCCAD